MVWSTLCKLLQKQTYDVLSHRYGTYLLTGGIILVIVSGFQFGEVALEWSQEKYAAVFNSFSDNLSGKSFQNRLCLPVPIDVVYTWVNGSDPQLLAHLRSFKAEMEMELNETRVTRCPFTHCILSLGVVLEPALPPGVDAEQITGSNPVLSRAVRTAELKAPSGDDSKIEQNVTVFYFDRPEEAKAATEEIITVQGHNFTLHAAYYTSDWTLANAVLLQDAMLMTGFPHTLTTEQLRDKLPDKFHKANAKVRVYESEGLAVIEVPVGDVEELVHTANFTIDGKEPTLNLASLIWNMQDVRYNEEIAASRFADNEELRYSLRSVQTFAPWVRHIYLVTNGQIPTWLNLDNPRLTVVTHQEIFVNSSHLPAFSSPSIECHLHRIPGLSDKFIYMNDDVMFGKEVWPDDFFTHAHGQKIYLTWPVPNCQDGCPSSWIRDGYCDKACNNTECEWDGGDCAGGAPNTFSDHGLAVVGDWHTNNEAMYCNSGCANNWVADRYCDQACNVKECGFDAGDCGITNFEKLTRLDLREDVTEYTAPKGETVLYINISAVFGEGMTLEEGTYDEDPILRTSTLAQKYKTLTIILFDNRNASNLHYHIKGKLNDTETEFFFNVSVDSTSEKQVKLDKAGQEGKDGSVVNMTSEAENSSNTNGKITESAFNFEDVAEELQQPRAVVPPVLRVVGTVPRDLTEYELDADTLATWKQLQEDMDQGDITNRGFEVKRAELWEDFVENLKKEGKTPIKSPLKEQVNTDRDDAGGRDILHVQPLGQVGHRDDWGGTVGHRENRGETDGEGKAEEVTDMKKFDSYLQSKQPSRSAKDIVDIVPQHHIPDVGMDRNGGVGDRMPVGRKEGAGNVLGLQAPAWPYNRGGNPMGKPRGKQVSKMTQGDGIHVGMDRVAVVHSPPEIQRELKGSPQLAKLVAKRLDEIEKTVEVKRTAEQKDAATKMHAAQVKNAAKGKHAAKEQRMDDVRHAPKKKAAAAYKAAKEAEHIKQRDPKGPHGREQKKDGQRQNAHVDGTANYKATSHRSRKLSAAIPSDFQMNHPLNNDLQNNEIKNSDLQTNDLQTDDLQAQVLNTDKVHGVEAGYRLGFLPWEKQRTFAALQKKQEKLKQQKAYRIDSHPPRRRLLDTFGDSLRHVNRLYNTAYGYSARKVPAHMPHFIDRNYMYELQGKFPKEWDATSSHRIRSSTDMQFAFAYMYYVVSEPKPTTVGDIFDELDNDRTGVLSDRELRTMATRLYELPLDLQTLTGMEQMLINCSQHLLPLATFTWGRQAEVYYEKEMPQVTKTLINNCSPVIELIQKNFKGRTKYRYEIVDDSEIAFKMIHTNVSQVVGQLDDIRRNPKKFICLNDNMDHAREEAKTVKAVLVDFYESILPTPSEFELPREYRNRFLHTTELREWRKYRDWLKLWTQVALGVLILFTVGSFFAEKFTSVKRRFFRPRTPSQYDDNQHQHQHAHKATARSGDQVGSSGEGPGGRKGSWPPDVVEV